MNRDNLWIVNILLCLEKLVFTFRFQKMIRESIVQKNWLNKQSIELLIDRLLCLDEFFLQHWRSSTDNFVEIQSVSESVVPPPYDRRISYLDIIGDSSSSNSEHNDKIFRLYYCSTYTKGAFQGPALSFFGPGPFLLFFSGSSRIFFSGARIRQFFS